MDPNTAQAPKQQSWQVKLFASAIRNQKYIFWVIRINYLLILGFLVSAGISAFSKSDNYFLTYLDFGILFGKLAIILLGVVVLPGILGRFGIKWQATRIITFFRRQLGITVFLLALSHYSILRSLPIFSGQIPFVFPAPIFEMIGMLAFFIFFGMYLTSNNWSMKKMGKWWNIMHKFIYVALWLLVLHTGLQSISIWTGLIFIFAVIETASLIYAAMKRMSLSSGSINR